MPPVVLTPVLAAWGHKEELDSLPNIFRMSLPWGSERAQVLNQGKQERDAWSQH